ncbi:MAG TPA: SDR family oxidoreductase [Phototrophicaceae bacterium]|jgi:NAD(P)-dependent dehydrogenase (short-subunit alcohol dehydrogenase family)|nr:SDR family oxidoreductase [Phototrophicaceae bacterium]
MNSKGRIALVTGAGTGIGKHTALLLWEAGYSVVLAGRRIEPLEQSVQEAGISNSRALVMSTDVTDPEAVSALFAAAVDKFGRLDVLFNNAGVGAPATALEDLSYEQWRTVLDTCVTGTFLCTQHAFRIMKQQNPRGGRIINNGSISAHTPRPHSAPYTAAKHAITGLTKATALDGRPFDINCGQIDIGNAATEMTDRMKNGVLQANGTVAVEPTMDVDHAARAVLYMANLPLDVNVPFMTVMATGMPFMGRG